MLASYLEAAGVTAVATNLNISRPAKPNSGRLHLTEQHIAAYTMTSLPFERLNGDGDNDVTDIKLAFLSLTSPHHLPHPYKVSTHGWNIAVLPTHPPRWEKGCYGNSTKREEESDI